tara:strand:+ start:640 stop:993 length:354 start_codon:yes stop_codon:yes gene_type:complete
MPKIIDGSKFTTRGVTAGTGATALYTVPSNHAAIIRHLSLTNNNAAAKKITVQYYDSKNTTYYYITDDLSIAANSYVNTVDGNFISLNAGDKIVLTAETAGTISALISAEEYYDPNR